MLNLILDYFSNDEPQSIEYHFDKVPIRIDNNDHSVAKFKNTEQHNDAFASIDQNNVIIDFTKDEPIYEQKKNLKMWR